MKIHFLIIFSALFTVNIIAQESVNLNSITNGTTVKTCSINFYDSGGPNGDYSLPEDYTITFSQATAGGTLQVKFEEFDVFYGNKFTTDTLFIYDGPNTSSPLIHYYSNFNADIILNNNIISTTGYLTFHFKTSITWNNPPEARSGWKAKVFCCNLLGTSSVTKNTSCSTPDGTARIEVSNGTLPYTYLWSPSAQNQTTQTATGLTSGSYYVLVEDANRCNKTFTNIVVTSTNNILLNVSSTDNNTCDNGNQDSCIYEGKKVVINEIMIMPGKNYSGSGAGADNTDGSIQAMYNTLKTGQEWVELYNPNPCEAINLGCYILGANTLSTSYAAFSFPPNTIIPPLGFMVIGGSNATNVNIKLNDYIGTAYLTGSGRWHLANGTGYIALYDPSGSIVDGVYWGASADVINTKSEFTKELVRPSGSGCNYSGDGLPSPSTMTSSFTYIGETSNPGVGPNTIGKTTYRESDGSNTWIVGGAGPAKNTPGACNASCATPWTGGSNKCNGSATIAASNGAENYTYIWSHAPSQNVSSFTNLCGGQYTVSVTSGGCTNTIKFTINNKENCDTSKLIVPDIFTPNKDGKNDEFGMDYKDIESFRCSIYSRWGNKVYEWTDITKGWDGKTSAGNTACDGVYFYIISAKGKDEVDYNLHGTVTLLR